MGAGRLLSEEAGGMDVVPDGRAQGRSTRPDRTGRLPSEAEGPAETATEGTAARPRPMEVTVETHGGERGLRLREVLLKEYAKGRFDPESTN